VASTPEAASWTDLPAYYPEWAAYRRWYLRIPGVQLALRRRGELVLSGAIGVSDLAAGTPLTEEHLFRIASHSKTFAAVLVLRLVERGRLRLDDAVGAHVPELEGAAIGRRTVAELLAHGGGVIRDSEDGDFWQGGRPFPDRAELLAIARADSAEVLPSTQHWKYSNIGYGLIGLVLEAVTGRGFPELVGAEIAGPLGLRDTGGELDPARVADYAAGHSGLATGRERRVLEHVDTRALAAATGCYATARDLTAFFSALLPGENSLLADSSQRRQRHAQWEVRTGEQRYGLGVFLETLAGTEVFGHTGGYPGHITCSYADPADGWALSVLTNAIDGAATPIAQGFVKLRALGRDATHARADDAAAARFTGRFSSLWGVLDVVRIDGRLFTVRPADPDPADDAVPVEVSGDTALRIVGGRGGNSYGELMRYDFGPDGAVRSMRADSGMTMTPWSLPAEEARA
jgi:CubicO group peptidase (beta-lactamase class C family)